MSEFAGDMQRCVAFSVTGPHGRVAVQVRDEALHYSQSAIGASVMDGREADLAHVTRVTVQFIDKVPDQV